MGKKIGFFGLVLVLFVLLSMNIYAAEVDFSLVLDSNQDGVADSDSVEEGADFDILVYLDLT